MMGSDEKSKILIFGGSGFLGKYMVKASVALGHLTYVYTRPINVGVATAHDKSSVSSKLDLLNEFEAMGVTIFYVCIISYSILIYFLLN